jgi:hypothetical protein
MNNHIIKPHDKNTKQFKKTHKPHGFAHTPIFNKRRQMCECVYWYALVVSVFACTAMQKPVSVHTYTHTQHDPNRIASVVQH